LGRRELGLAAALPAIFALSQVLAFFFPDTRGIESEFSHLVPRIGPFFVNELPAAMLLLGLIATGFMLATRDIASVSACRSGADVTR
jgi:hypothetical protein